MTGHFKNLNPDLEPRLKKAAEAIVSNNKFQPYVFIQAMFNEKRHPVAITEVMEYIARTPEKWAKIEKQWAYALAAVKSKSYNYYERDDIVKGKLDKKEFNKWIEGLKAFING